MIVELSVSPPLKLSVFALCVFRLCYLAHTHLLLLCFPDELTLLIIIKLFIFSFSNILCPEFYFTGY